MVRKQFNITQPQEAALKQRASELGCSESELVRRALDAALGTEPGLTEPRKAALDDFLEAAKLARKEHLAENPGPLKSRVYEDWDAFEGRARDNRRWVER